MNWLRLSPLTKFLGRTFTTDSVATQQIKHKIPRKRCVITNAIFAFDSLLFLPCFVELSLIHI